MSTQEWLDSIETARQMAISQSISNSYSGDDIFKGLQSDPSKTSQTLDLDAPASETAASSGRHTLQKHSPSSDADSSKGRKRFSKRQSKSGLAAVF